MYVVFSKRTSIVHVPKKLYFVMNYYPSDSDPEYPKSKIR